MCTQLGHPQQNACSAPASDDVGFAS